MIPLFLGLTFANLLVLCATFAVGLLVTDAAGQTTRAYGYHLTIGFAAGMLATLTHVVVYMYFMATSKWLAAAATKANLDTALHVLPAQRRKRNAFMAMMAAILTTMIAMFAGAAADPTVNPLWPGEVHMLLGAACIVVNAGCALIEYRLIKMQSDAIDHVAAAVNELPGSIVQQT